MTRKPLPDDKFEARFIGTIAELNSNFFLGLADFPLKLMLACSWHVTARNANDDFDKRLITPVIQPPLACFFRRLNSQANGVAAARQQIPA